MTNRTKNCRCAAAQYGTGMHEKRRSSDNLVGAISHALFDTDMVMTRLILAGSELLWGLLLMWPGHLFARPTYIGMAKVMPEEAWSAVFLLSAVTQFTIVVLNDFHGRFARYFAGWNAALWVFVVASMFLSVSPPPAAISGEAVLALAAFWVWFRPYKLREFILRGRQDVRESKF